MARFPHNVLVANILVSDSLPLTETLALLAEKYFPKLPEIPDIDTISAADGFLYNNTHAWDFFWRDRSLCVISAADPVRTDWLHQAVAYYSRPVAVIGTDNRQVCFYHQLMNYSVSNHFHEQIQLERGTRRAKRLAVSS